MRARSARSIDGYLVVRNSFILTDLQLAGSAYRKEILYLRNVSSGLLVDIVEYEQNGSARTKYGTATLKQLSVALKTSIGRGFSVDSR